MSVDAEIAAMRLALDAFEDRAAPPVLKLAAWRYIYRGEREFFLGLMRDAADSLGLTARPPPRP